MSEQRLHTMTAAEAEMMDRLREVRKWAFSQGWSIRTFVHDVIHYWLQRCVEEAEIRESEKISLDSSRVWE